MRLFGHDDSANIEETLNKSYFCYRSRANELPLVRMLYHQYQSKTAMKLGSWNNATLRHVSNDVLS